MTLDDSGSYSGSLVADLDLNGQEDVTLLPFDEALPKVFVGEMTGQTYAERGFPLGFSPGATSGGVAADFNGDKDVDFFLGRDTSDKFFFKNTRPDGSDPVSSSQNWIRFNLETLGNCNESLIGTTVIVSSGVDQWMQTVDGGSGRGGQRANELHFGLGSVTGPVDVDIIWPVSAPYSQTGLSLNTIHTIVDDAIPEISGTSVRFAHDPFPGGADWVFTWTTPERGSEELDEVELDFGSYVPGDYCWFMANTTLSWGDPDVEISIFPLVTGGWGHKVIWRDKPCFARQVCDFQFKVRSSVGIEQAQESNWFDFGEFDVCIKKLPGLGN